MQLDFTGRQMEITPALRKYTEKHMRKLARVLRDRFDGHVILTAEKHRRIAEITLKFRDHVLVGVQETAEVLSSINGAIDKLERQATEYWIRSQERIGLDVLVHGEMERGDMVAYFAGTPAQVGFGHPGERTGARTRGPRGAPGPGNRKDRHQASGHRRGYRRAGWRAQRHRGVSQSRDGAGEHHLPAA